MHEMQNEERVVASYASKQRPLIGSQIAALELGKERRKARE